MGQAPARAKPKKASPPAQKGTDATADVAGGPVHSSSNLGAFYGASPVFGLGMPVQAKLVVGEPNDAFEQEADTVADPVVAGRPAPPITSIPAGGLGGSAQRQEEEEEPIQAMAIQRQEEEEEEPIQTAIQRQVAEEEEPVQRQEMEDEEEVLQGKFTPSETPAQFQGDGGEAANRTGMPGRLKAGLEALSGMGLSGIRVHTNSSKPAQLNALAYTQGQDIHVGPGQEQHLPHEGWHAVQQMQGRVTPTMQARGVSINDDASMEREADVMGTKALQTKGAEQATTGSAHLHRDTPQIDTNPGFKYARPRNRSCPPAAVACGFAVTAGHAAGPSKRNPVPVGGRRHRWRT